MIKHDGHLRTRGKCRKHEPQASVFYISTFLCNFSVISERPNEEREKEKINSGRKHNNKVSHGIFNLTFRMLRDLKRQKLKRGIGN